MKSKEWSVDLWDRFISRHISGEGCKNVAAALRVPMSTVTSIMGKWRKFGTTRTRPRAGQFSKLSDQRTRVLGRWPRTRCSFVEGGEPRRRVTISAAIHQSDLYGRVARWKPLLSERHMKRPQAMRNKTLLFWTKIDFFGVNTRSHVWWKPGFAHHQVDTIPTVKHCGGASTFKDVFQQQDFWN